MKVPLSFIDSRSLDMELDMELDIIIKRNSTQRNSTQRNSQYWNNHVSDQLKVWHALNTLVLFWKIPDLFGNDVMFAFQTYW